jgi:catechol 2,3-dioxygenase-like lactoylglutathione lyase family enzyme
MTDHPDGSVSCYFFDIDDNLLFLPTRLYLWNAEKQVEQAISSGDFARIQGELGRSARWQAWSARPETFRDFRDRAGVAVGEQAFIADLLIAVCGAGAWKGPSWPLLEYAAVRRRPVALITARGHAPATIEYGLSILASKGLLAGVPPLLGIYTVTNDEVRTRVGAADPAMTVPSVKKLAIKHAVVTALKEYGAAPPHRFGMSDDDPANIVLAISAMRDCKQVYPDKRFFVINTNHDEFEKLEIFSMTHPVTALSSGKHLLGDRARAQGTAAVPTSGGNVSIYVSNMDNAVDFYTRRLGLALRTRIDNEWAEFDAGDGLTLGLHPARPPQTVTPGTAGAINIELRVERPLETVVENLRSCGVSFSGEIQNYPNVRLASLLDPDKNVILLAEVLHG